MKTTLLAILAAVSISLFADVELYDANLNSNTSCPEAPPTYKLDQEMAKGLASKIVSNYLEEGVFVYYEYDYYYAPKVATGQSDLFKLVGVEQDGSLNFRKLDGVKVEINERDNKIVIVTGQEIFGNEIPIYGIFIKYGNDKFDWLFVTPGNVSGYKMISGDYEYQIVNWKKVW
jgi:hypothetical protein